MVTKAGALLSEQGVENAAMVQGPLAEGVASQGPYDVIVIAGGVERLPTGLLAQLKPDGGRLVTILMEDGVGHATLITRHGEAHGERRLFEAYPAAILPGFGAAPGFVF